MTQEILGFSIRRFNSLERALSVHVSFFRFFECELSLCVNGNILISRFDHATKIKYNMHGFAHCFVYIHYTEVNKGCVQRRSQVRGAEEKSVDVCVHAVSLLCSFYLKCE